METAMKRIKQLHESRQVKKWENAKQENGKEMKKTHEPN